MAYSLVPDKTVADEVRRIAADELRAAADLLASAKASTRDEAIHEARKGVKKTRALLRLVRRELGDAYELENRRLRDTGRILSPYRDAGALIETFDSLRKQFADELGQRRLAAVRRGLEAEKRQQAGKLTAAALARVAARLRAAAKRAERWSISSDGFAAWGPGYASVYRQGRRAMARARRSGRPEDFHEWRKRLKDHWYHVRLLEKLGGSAVTDREPALKELQTALGDEHNLIVLRACLDQRPKRFGPAADVGLCQQLALRHAESLRTRTLDLGGALYAEKPKAFAKKLKPRAAAAG